MLLSAAIHVSSSVMRNFSSRMSFARKLTFREAKIGFKVIAKSFIQFSDNLMKFNFMESIEDAMRIYLFSHEAIFNDIRRTSWLFHQSSDSEFAPNSI